MSFAAIHRVTVVAMFVFAIVTVVVVSVIAAPYGRHARRGWGPSVPSRVGWVVMESPAVFAFALIFFLGPHRAEIVPLLFFAVWQFHYVQRALVYPFTLPRESKPMPVLVMASGFAFNVLNSVVNAGWIGTVGEYPVAWAHDPRFVAGLAVFAGGHAMNRQADRVLRSLRAPGETGYKVPRGGIYRWVSCPNYLGEIIEWIGWAIATWSLAGLAFAVYTVANLGPRAVAHHRRYRRQFPDYPPERKALIPFLL